MTDGGRRLVGMFASAEGRRATRTLVTLAALTSLGQVASLASVVLLTYVLGRSGFGVLATALTTQSYLAVLGTLGSRQVALQESARDVTQTRSVASAFVALSAVGGSAAGVATCLVAVALSAVGRDELHLLMWVAAGNALAVLSPQPFFDARHRQRVSASLILVAEVLALLALIAFRDSLSVSTVGSVYAGKWAATTLVGWAIWWHSERWLPTATSRSEVLRLAKRSLPMLGATLLGLVPQNAGVLAVRVFAGAAATGTFGVAQLAGQAYVLLAFLGVSVIQPHVAGPRGEDAGFRRKAFATSLALFAVLALAFTAGAAIVIELLLPREFSPATLPAVVVVWSGFLLVAASLLVFYALRSGMEARTFPATLAALVAWLLAIVVLVPRLGALGGALSALLFAAVQFCGLLFGLRDELSLKGPEDRRSRGPRSEDPG